MDTEKKTDIPDAELSDAIKDVFAHIRAKIKSPSCDCCKRIDEKCVWYNVDCPRLLCPECLEKRDQSPNANVAQ